MRNCNVRDLQGLIKAGTIAIKSSTQLKLVGSAVVKLLKD